MRLSDFDFDLPEDHIALRPAEPRDADVLERTYGAPMEVLHHGGMPVVVDVATAPGRTDR